MSRQTGHTDHIPGTRIFTGQRSQRGRNVNRFCYSLHEEQNREAYKKDPDAYMDGFGLSDWEKQKLKEKDWKALVEEGGANVYMLFKLGAINGEGLASYGAQQRGQTLEEFMKTRNVPLKQNT